jgi:hypothetical protein
MPPLRARLATVALVLLALLAAPSVAAAQRTAESISARTAAALERSPVVVDPPYDNVITPAAERRLVRKIETNGKPILMALVPLVEGDQFGGEARPFVATLRDRLGRDGIYVAVDDRYLRVFEYRAGRSRYGGPADDAMTLANYAEENGTRSTTAYERTLLERAELFLDNLALPPAELEKRVARFESERDERIGYSTGDGGGSALGVVLVGIAVLLIVAILLRRRRNRSGARPAPRGLPVLPDRVFEHARAARRANLHEDADDELMKLSKLLDDQPVPQKPAAQDAYQRALDAYAAARRRTTGAEAPTVDLVGALVLVDHARNDLAAAVAIDAGRKPPKRPALCMFDPLHGRATRDVRWQRGKRKITVPACKACASAIKAGTAPDALRDGDQPYFERDTVWARTGFGTFDDDLVERVARGER